jgi:hypothetical protein
MGFGMNNLSPEQEAALENLLKDPRRIATLIEMADEDAKRKWLFTIVRKTAAYIAVVLSSIILFWDNFVRFIRGIQ